MAYAPTNSSLISPSVTNLRSADKFSKEFVIDRPIQTMFNLGAVSMTTTDTLVGVIPGTGHPVFTACNSSGILGLILNADNEGYSWLWPLPIDLDVAQIIRFRVTFSNSEAVNTALTAAFTFAYNECIAGTTAVAVAATSLTKTSTTAALGANVIQNSNWGSMAASTLAGTPGDDFLTMNAKIDVTTMADATLYCGQVQFYRKFVG